MATRFMTAAVLLGFAITPMAPLQQTSPLSARVQSELANSKAHYASQSDPVGRAKALEKLSHAEIQAAREEADAGNVDASLQFLKDYYGQANAAHDGLDKIGVNAEKHSNGFRQLQISVRVSMKAIREIAGQVPFAQRQPFEAVQQDLEALDHRLILELFPRQPGHELEKEKREL